VRDRFKVLPPHARAASFVGGSYTGPANLKEQPTIKIAGLGGTKKKPVQDVVHKKVE